jgi:hypothetical protein
MRKHALPVAYAAQRDAAHEQAQASAIAPLKLETRRRVDDAVMQ